MNFLIPDKKLTDNLSNNSPNLSNGLSDNEIVKALECCSVGTFACDEQCPCFHSKINLKVTSCRFELIGDALDLINRQKAEIEKLELLNGTLTASCDGYIKAIELYKAEIERLNKFALIRNLDQFEAETKSEAYREFAERLKEKSSALARLWIDNELKELVGEDDG